LSSTSVPIVLTDTDPPQDIDAPISADMVADDEQSSDPPSIRLALHIVNHADDSIEVGNPYDSLTYQITDGEGWPVTVPSPARRRRVNGPQRPASSKASYLALTGMSVDGEELEVDEAGELRRLTLEPGAVLELGLAIPAVLVAYGETATAPPADGEYHVTMKFALEWFATPDARSSALVRTAEPLTIAVGSPASV
jgi:hypothetical protein